MIEQTENGVGGVVGAYVVKLTGETVQPVGGWIVPDCEGMPCSAGILAGKWQPLNGE